jgi:metal-responsive CopG/Arc/MetJ family transcriptional regulator
MKNVTLSLDEAVLRDARRIAAERSTSVNALIREFLDQLTARESRAHAARQRILKLSRSSKAARGASTWTRDQLHAR